MRTAIFISVLLLNLVGCTASTSQLIETLDYSRAIEEAEFRDLDRRGDLRGCVAKWDPESPSRRELLRKVLDSRNELKEDSVLLEIGSSGWIRYDYVYVANARLRSSYDGAADVDVSGTALEKHLNKLSEQDLTNMAGQAYGGGVDAPCYFLSIRKGASMKIVAVYGSLHESSTDLLIKELLAVVRGRK